MKLEQLKIELATVNAKIERMTGKEDYTDRLAKSFHLGMVGGSGRNTHSLNKKRERCLNKTIDDAVTITGLYKRQGELEHEIKDIETGGPEKRAEKKKRTAELLAQYWTGLKAGDSIDIGNGPTLITKKNRMSLETGSGCKWTAAEIIGKDAATLLKQAA